VNKMFFVDEADSQRKADGRKCSVALISERGKGRYATKSVAELVTFIERRK